MLHFEEMNQISGHHHLRYAADTGDDQIADFIGTDGLDELHEAEQRNPKSKTTNMGSLLKQINKQIKKG